MGNLIDQIHLAQDVSRLLQGRTDDLGDVN